MTIHPDDPEADGGLDYDSDDEQGDDADWLDIVGDSNAGAYQRVEERTGPPLSYVSEKLRGALEQIHHSYGRLGDDDAARSAQAAFRYALVAYLALNNMLALAGDHGLPLRLLGVSSAELDRWLDAVDAEGSVTG